MYHDAKHQPTTPQPMELDIDITLDINITRTDSDTNRLTRDDVSQQVEYAASQSVDDIITTLSDTDGND